jgi:DNA repair ATPase RecN
MEESMISITQAEYDALNEQSQRLCDVEAMYKAALMGIDPDNIDDALTLAKKRVTDEKGLDEALSEIAAKFPNLKAVSESTQKSVTTGTKTGKSAPVLSGVEAAFLRKNPGITL